MPLPELSQERRNELVKVAHKYAEQARVAVRNVRRDGMDHAEADGEGRRHLAGRAPHWSDEVQKLTDRHIKTINQLLDHKEKDILQV